METSLRCDQLDLMQKCVSKVKEITDMLYAHGAKVYCISDISVADANFGSVTMVIDLDFREKNRG